MTRDVAKPSTWGGGGSSCLDQHILGFWPSRKNFSWKCCRLGGWWGEVKNIFRTNISLVKKSFRTNRSIVKKNFPDQHTQKSFDKDEQNFQFFNRKRYKRFKTVKIANLRQLRPSFFPNFYQIFPSFTFNFKQISVSFAPTLGKYRFHFDQLWPTFELLGVGYYTPPPSIATSLVMTIVLIVMTIVLVITI